MATGPLQNEVLKTYEVDGFVIARAMFSSEEIGLLRRAAKEDRELDQHSFGRGSTGRTRTIPIIRAGP